jgi:hypothetical protein
MLNNPQNEQGSGLCCMEMVCYGCHRVVFGELPIDTKNAYKERNLKLSVQTDGPHFYGFCNPPGVKIKCVCPAFYYH